MSIELRMTVEAFDAWMMRPEHHDKRFEYIQGKIVEVVPNHNASEIVATITVYLGMYLLQNKIGRLTTSDGGYMVNGERYIPDMGYISMEKQPHPSKDAYNPTPPDLAVEVISNPANAKEQQDLRVKLANYHAAGVVVWIVDPDARHVEIHRAGKSSEIFRHDQTLVCEDVFPGLKLSVQAIFPE